MERTKMRPQGRSTGHQRPKFRPALEGLETRDLPSASPGAVAVHVVPTPNPSFAPPDTPVKAVFHQPLIPEGGVAALDSFAQLIRASYPQIPNLVYENNLPGDPTSVPDTADIQPYTPTLREMEREQFIAKYEGRYTIGPGRFSDEAYTIDLVSRTGGSNQYSRGLAQLLLVEPKVSTTDDPNSLVQGVGSNFPYSTLQSGDNLITDITGSTVNGKQYGKYLLPTEVTWYVDPTGTGGYTPTFNQNQGAGILRMYWIPSKTPAPGTLGSGRVVWLYQGLYNDSGIFNGIDPEVSS